VQIDQLTNALSNFSSEVSSAIAAYQSGGTLSDLATAFGKLSSDAEKIQSGVSQVNSGLNQLQ
jgi:X-X-X-Leu-X-X-Gly heptad repeat protein